MNKHSIGIIGAGSVGIAVGGALQRRGHEVVYGLRPGSSSAADVAQAGGRAGTLAEAAARAVVIFAVPGNALAEAARTAGNLAGRVVIDATNSFGATAGGPALQALLPGAHVVKAFNTTGAENMGDAHRLAQAPFMPICGDDAASKQLVLGLATDLGFEAVDAGPLKNAELLESMARLWVSLSRGGLGRDWAFALTRKRA